MTRIAGAFLVVGFCANLTACGLDQTPNPPQTDVSEDSIAFTVTTTVGQDGSIFIARNEDPSAGPDGVGVGTVGILANDCVGIVAEGVGEVIVLWPAGSSPVMEGGQFAGVKTPEGILVLGETVTLQGGYATPGASLWDTVTEQGCSGSNRFFATLYP